MDARKSKTEEPIVLKLTSVGETDEGKVVETVGCLLGLIEQGQI